MSDEINWLRMARNVNRGVFDKVMDDAVRDALSIGLRGYAGEEFEKAMGRLWPKGIPKEHQR